MKNLLTTLAILMGISSYSNQTFGQNEPQDSTKVSWDWYHIVKQNGVEYIAQIISDDGREVLIFTKELGKIYIPKSEIKSMKKIDRPQDVVAGEFRDSGPFTTRYYFTTNALPIKKGENYALVNLYGPEVHFAVTNSTSVGVMATWIGSPIALAVKQTFKTKDPMWNLSIGTITGTSGYLNSFRGFGGLHFANVTYGNRNNNVTLAGGFGHFSLGEDDYTYGNQYIEFPSNTYPTINGTLQKSPTRTAGLFALSGITKVGAKASFIFDVIFAFSNPKINQYTSGNLIPDSWDQNGNYTPGINYIKTQDIKDPRTYFIFMPGMRFQKNDKQAFQFALAGVSAKVEGDLYTFPIPMCSWFFKF
ncbi:MAG: hypothetical protein ACK5B9_13630 [Flavobacteriia bacterium]